MSLLTQGGVGVSHLRFPVSAAEMKTTGVRDRSLEELLGNSWMESGDTQPHSQEGRQPANRAGGQRPCLPMAVEAHLLMLPKGFPPFLGSCLL